MNPKLVLIVVLVVAGAILLAKSRSSSASTDTARPREFGSREEAFLTAKLIIDELEVEAAEALPSDLKPNMEALSLSDEEEAELLTILNSVVSQGTVGTGFLGATRLGAAATVALGTKKPDIVEKRSTLTLLKKELDELAREHRTLVKTVKQLKSSLKKRNSYTKKVKWQKQLVTANARMATIRGLTKPLQKQIADENKRLDAEKKQKVVVDKATRDARKKEAKALHLQRESEDKYAKDKAKLSHEERAREAMERDAKRDADKAAKRALAEKERAEQAAAANASRVEYEKVVAKRKAADLAARNARLKKQKEEMEEKERIAQIAFEKYEKRAKKNKAAAAAKRKATEAEIEASEKLAFKEAAKIQDPKKREKVQRELVAEANAGKKQRNNREVERERAEREKDERGRENREKNAIKTEGRRSGIRRQEQAIERKKAENESDAKKRAERFAAMEADMKQKEDVRRMKDKEARDAKEKEAAVKRKNVIEGAKARDTMEQNKKDTEAKKRKANKSAADTRKAENNKRLHDAGVAEKGRARAEKDAKAKTGISANIKRITGIDGEKYSARDLFHLDLAVVEELHRYFVSLGSADPRQANLVRGVEKVLMYKKLVALGNDIGVDFEKTDFDRADFESMTYSQLSKIIAFIDSTSPDDKIRKYLPHLNGIRKRKTKGAAEATIDTAAASDKLDIPANIERITGLDRHNLKSETTMASLEPEVLEELLQYFVSLGPMGQAYVANLKDTILLKNWLVLGEEIGYDPKKMKQLDFGGLDIIGLSKVIAFIETHAPDHRVLSEHLAPLKKLKEHKTAAVAAEMEAEEAARAKKQADDLQAIEDARVAQESKARENASRELDEKTTRLDAELAEVEQAKAAEKESLAQKQQQELEAIEREKEKEKEVVTQAVVTELRQDEQDIRQQFEREIADARDDASLQIAAIDQRVEDGNSLRKATLRKHRATLEAEIAKTQDATTVADLKKKFEAGERAAAKASKRAIAAGESEKKDILFALGQREKQLLSDAEKALVNHRAQSEKKLEEGIKTVESDKQELVELKENVHELETKEVELEADIKAGVLEDEKVVVEEDQFAVNTQTSVIETVHPRSSKKDRVEVSRKTNHNGSSFVKMSVPSDLFPGQFDKVSFFLSKESTKVLAQYRQIYKKIVAEGSLAGVSPEEKTVLASAGGVFKRIRGQYVKQRRERVTARLDRLVIKMAKL